MTISLPGAVRLRPHGKDRIIEVGPVASGPAALFTFNHLKTWAPGAGTWMYTLAPDADIPISIIVGYKVVITGGTGWTPGTYTIITVANAFGTGDGTRNMVQVSGGPPAAASTIDGVGYMTA